MKDFMCQQKYEWNSHFNLGISLLKMKAFGYEEYLKPTVCFIGKNIDTKLFTRKLD